MVPIDKVCGFLCLYICGLAVALARITTNGIDDCQKTFSHCAWGVGAANNGKSRKKKSSARTAYSVSKHCLGGSGILGRSDLPESIDKASL